MRLEQRLMILIVWLLPAWLLPAWGQRDARMELVADGGDRVEVRFALGEVALRAGDEGLQEVVAEGMGTASAVEGCPLLPEMSRLLLLPRGTRAEVVDWTAGDSVVLSLPSGGVLRPAGGATVKGALVQTEGFFDEKAYGAARYTARPAPLTLDRLGTMGENEVYRLTVSPMAYYPARGEVMASTRVTATLRIAATKAGRAAGSAVRRYLIATRAPFVEGLQPFVGWKRQEGYDVEVLVADTGSCDSVKALIGRHWMAADGREPYGLLIVGDVAQVQSFIGSSRPAGLNTHLADLYYAEQTGDFLPDALFGRWPVNDTAELRAVVEKTLRYEQGIGLDTQQLRRLLVVGGNENQEPAPTTIVGQVHYVGREAKAAHPQIDTVCYRHPASANQRSEVLADMERGTAAVYYTAHCTTGGWTLPGVSFGSIDTLALHQPTVYINNCCESNDFGGTCFGEQLLRKPGAGAVGVVGATNATLWNEDYYWTVGPKYPFSVAPQFDSLQTGMTDRWLGRVGDAATLGEVVQAGNLAVSAFGSPYERFYWEIYCLLGDPVLRPYVGVPQRAAVEAADSLVQGAVQVRLYATAGATVTLVQGDRLLAVGQVPSAGVLTLSLRESLRAGTALLTATGAGLLPAVDTVHVAAGGRAALTDLQVGDSLLRWTLVAGDSLLRHVAVRLVQDSADTVYGATVVAQTVVADSVAARGQLPMAMRYAVMEMGRVPRWRGRLVVGDTGEVASLAVQGAVAEVYPQVRLSVCTADSVAVSSLASGAAYLLHAQVEGTADSMRLEVLEAGGHRVAEGAAEWLPFAVGQQAEWVAVVSVLWRGRWCSHDTVYITVGDEGDGFEQGFACRPWEPRGTRPWTLDSSVVHSGRYSVRSGAIEYRQTSDLQLAVNLPRAGQVSFYAKTSSEEMYDKLQLLVDGASVWQMWGETDWRRYQVNIAAGRHVLRWRYVKDESRDEGSDCAWIDDVRLPLVLWDSAVACSSREALQVAVAAREAAMAVWPNPTTGGITIDGASLDGLVRIEVLDGYGRRVLSQQCDGQPVVQVDLSQLPAGFYMLQVEGRSGVRWCKVVVGR